MEDVLQSTRINKPKVWILLECPEPLHHAIKIAAATEQLTLRSMCLKAFQECVTRRGLLKEGTAGDH